MDTNRSIVFYSYSLLSPGPKYADNKSEMKKYYVLDTNILISDPKAIYKFEDNTVVIPITVIEELDTLKGRQDEIGRMARHTIREIEAIRVKDPDNFDAGIELPSKGKLRIELNHTEMDKLPYRVHDETCDDRILATAFKLKEEGSDVTLVTKDANLRIKASSVQIKAEEYRNEKVEIDELYTGQISLDVSSDVIDAYFLNKTLDLSPLITETTPIYPNELVILSHGNQSAVGRAIKDGTDLTLKPFFNNSFSYHVSPKNIEQEFALQLLMDPEIDLVTLAGPAGTGKTLLALLIGVEQVISRGAFNRLLVARPLIPMGNDIGYLPGDIDEKMAVWLKPFHDNLEHIMSSNGQSPDDTERLFESGIIEVAVLSYIRGRSIPNQFILIDECQNLERHTVRSVLTRVGKDSKACLTGDLSQIDNPLIDTVTNGLTHVIENLKNEPTVGHITLTKGVRSKLATMIAEKL